MIIAETKKEEREKPIGLIELMTGIGTLLGPVWGSIMYKVAGYAGPFGTCCK